MSEKKHPSTPDGRYFVCNGRLWRCTNPALNDDVKTALVKQLMTARRAVKNAKSTGDQSSLLEARRAVNQAKIALGERGPTWWNDDSDFNMKMVKNTPYADWWRQRQQTEDK